MEVDLLFTHIPITEERLKDHTVIVIDVLRASTTISIALKNGAREVIPTVDVPSAIQLAENLSRDNLLLCGEREGRIIEGFDLGNSPIEYTADTVNGKSLIFCSTNGSITISKTASAKGTVVAGFINAAACIDYIIGQNDKFLFICAGNKQQFCLEDVVCGGLM
ncbi:MAG: 2-phosphosulfolactate phosphatase, partial [FCB group bacterium]|nr:2-phosphosulfolactate phosphatase [FCB group bacterium]